MIYGGVLTRSLLLHVREGGRRELVTRVQVVFDDDVRERNALVHETLRKACEPEGNAGNDMSARFGFGFCFCFLSACRVGLQAAIFSC